jgi:rSAM/selenodomain-associated transferase 2
MLRGNEDIMLSIIIPVLNEADGIGALLSGLVLQDGVGFEVIICDGGSTDGTTGRILELVDTLPFPVLVIRGERGRGAQMNASARAARGLYFLFLHADSSFPDRGALCNGLAAMREFAAKEGHDRVAGHFALRFRRSDDSSPFFYYYCECKARLNRGGCIHGDQGFLVSRSFFAETGMFDEACIVLEDTRFSEVVRGIGQWILLPAEILTSVRRFEKEGVAARQFLNAVILTLDAVGREDLIRCLPGIYAHQENAGKLRISPYIDGIIGMLSVSPLKDRIRFWRSVGRYACLNAWQLAFAADLRICFRKGLLPGCGDYVRLRRFDRYLAGIINSRLIAVTAACMIWFLFRMARLIDGTVKPS